MRSGHRKRSFCAQAPQASGASGDTQEPCWKRAMSGLACSRFRRDVPSASHFSCSDSLADSPLIDTVGADPMLARTDARQDHAPFRRRHQGTRGSLHCLAPAQDPPRPGARACTCETVKGSATQAFARGRSIPRTTTTGDGYGAQGTDGTARGVLGETWSGARWG